MNTREILAGKLSLEAFQLLECDWMTSRSTVILAGSDSDNSENASEVRTDGSRPTPGPLDDVGSLLVKIFVVRED